ncbi:MAG: PH domain-containing protein [Anaerolineales bacterium]|nr:PH domain-containing protein [Anaerolineales bacterium]
MNQFAQQGVDALKSGDKSRARQFLQRAVETDPSDVQAWLWLSRAVETDREKAQCLQQALRLDPDNPMAAKGLTQLIARGALSVEDLPSPAPVSVPPPAHAEPLSTASAPSKPQNDNGAAVFVTRPSLIPLFVAGLLLVIVLLIFWLLMLALLPKDETGTLLRTLSTVILILCAAGAGIRWSVAFAKHFFVRYTLTTRHLLVERGMFSRSRKTIPIQRIQDVATHQRWIERLFGIGDVIVQSAGEMGAVRLRSLPHCQEYTEKILEAVQRKG